MFHFGPRHWLVMGSFIYAVALEVVLVPPQVWRTIRDRTVAPSAAVSMMQAPCSLNSLTFGVLRRAAAPGFVLSKPLDAPLAHALFAASTLVFWLTLYGVWDRRAAIKARGFDLSWAAFTFPSCSTAIVALQYGSVTSDPASSRAPAHLLLALRAYSYVVAFTVAAVVIGVAMRILAIACAECARRLRRSPPSRRYWAAWSPTRLPTPMRRDNGHFDSPPARGHFGRLAPFDEAAEDSDGEAIPAAADTPTKPTDRRRVVPAIKKGTGLA